MQSSLKSPFRNYRFFHLLLVLLGLSLGSAFSADTTNPVVQVRGEVDNPFELTTADFKSMSRVKVHARDHDGTEATYEGISLWDIIERAKPRLGEKANSGIARGCVVIHAADKYRATFALAELHPGYTDNKIILADERDGKPLSASQGPFQVIAPDKIHARYVRQVVALEVIFPGDDGKK